MPENNGRSITVLLVDDQAIVGAAVKRMLAEEPDISLHFCQDPAAAIGMANDLHPTVILQDLVMPDIDGLTLLKFFRANTKTRDVPMIVMSSKEEPTIKAQAFQLGANDYLVKLPDKLELIARIRYHSKGYIAQLERNEAYQKLAESQRLLAEEVGQAAKYVASLLPPPIQDGPVRVKYRFLACSALGGDAFGYRWLDDDHFVVYMLDVSGHGVGASLLSVSAMNVLGSAALPNTDFRNPSQVLGALNNTFLMEKHDNKYFTIWYCVFKKSTRELFYSGGGHPPLLVLTGPDQQSAQWRHLEVQGPMIGVMEDMPYDCEVLTLGAFARIYVYTDGCYEIERPEGPMWTFDEFFTFIRTLPMNVSIPDVLLEHCRRLHGAQILGDDFSMIELQV